MNSSPGAAAATATAADSSIRPFHVGVSDEALADLRRRIAGTKWPKQKTVTDASQGVQLATMRELARYWEKDYDWRKVESTLKALPQFTTNIDGVEIHSSMSLSHFPARDVCQSHLTKHSGLTSVKLARPSADLINAS